VGDAIDATGDSLENMAVCIGDVLTEITSLPNAIQNKCITTCATGGHTMSVPTG
jgi:hypothetical protein